MFNYRIRLCAPPALSGVRDQWGHSGGTDRSFHCHLGRTLLKSQGSTHGCDTRSRGCLAGVEKAETASQRTGHRTIQERNEGEQRRVTAEVVPELQIFRTKLQILCILPNTSSSIPFQVYSSLPIRAQGAADRAGQTALTAIRAGTFG